MKNGRTVMTVLVAGCALTASAMADQPVGKSAHSNKVFTGTAAAAPAHVTPTVRILANWDRVPVAGAPGRPQPRGPIVGYNNQDCEACSAGLNVGYQNAGSYDGSNPSTTAYLFGLADMAPLQAPSNPNASPPIPNPTDILWNEYTGDDTIWPGGPDAAAAITEYSFVTARVNQGATDRMDGYRILFFSADGMMFEGGFEFQIPTPAGQGFYQQVILDLTALDPPLFVPRSGLCMVDCPPPAEGQPTVGVGLALAGGDLANTDFPTPESLVQVGTIDSATWLFADGETGQDGPPSMVDPMFDGMDGVSYLDVLNTGFLVNWGFTTTTPAGEMLTFTHDFPMRLTVSDGTPQVGACVFVAGNTCFVTTQADCDNQGGQFLGVGTVCGDNSGACCINGQCSEVIPAICTAQNGEYQGDFTTCVDTVCNQPNCPCDWNHDTTLNSQDFFDFLTGFFENNGDFNNDGSTNSQDFFDFLTCFFAPPNECL